MRRTVGLWLVALIPVLLVMLAGCGGVSSNAAQSSPTAPAAPAGALQGSRWRLQSMGARGAEKNVEGTAPLLLQFEAGGKVSGSGGCNTFGGTYKVSGQNLTISELVSTLRACTDETIGEQESRYLKALQQVTRFTLAGDSLMIEYGEGQTVLNFVRASS